MELSEREEIAELVHRYADAVTNRDIEGWTACWAEDATWSLRPGQPAVGRDAIVALLISALSTLDGVVQNVLNGQVHIDGHGERASGRWYIQEHLRRVTGEAVLFLAHYDDTYTKRDGAWCFTSRTLVTHYQGPPDLSGRFTTTDASSNGNHNSNNDSNKEGMTP